MDDQARKMWEEEDHSEDEEDYISGLESEGEEQAGRQQQSNRKSDRDRTGMGKQSAKGKGPATIKPPAKPKGLNYVYYYPYLRENVGSVFKERTLEAFEEVFLQLEETNSATAREVIAKETGIRGKTILWRYVLQVQRVGGSHQNIYAPLVV